MSWGTTDLVSLVGGAVAGALLGVLFFGGLWLTLRRIGSARHPGLLVLGSYLARLTLAGVGFLFLARAGAAPLLAGLVGFVAVRVVLVARARGGMEGAAGEAPVAEHAAREGPWS